MTQNSEEFEKWYKRRKAREKRQQERQEIREELNGIREELNNLLKKDEPPNNPDPTSDAETPETPSPLNIPIPPESTEPSPTWLQSLLGKAKTGREARAKAQKERGGSLVQRIVGNPQPPNTDPAPDKPPQP